MYSCGLPCVCNVAHIHVTVDTVIFNCGLFEVPESPQIQSTQPPKERSRCYKCIYSDMLSLILLKVLDKQ